MSGVCVEHIMGMPISIDVRDPHIDTAMLDDVFAWFRRVDELFSTYRPESEISQINRGELDVADAHPDVRAVLQRCEQLRFVTNGYFDIRVAGESSTFVDPSGLVKGWSVDRATRLLKEAGGRNFSINAGGDICVQGGALPDSVWRIGIQHPLLTDRVARVIAVSDLAIATSAEYARGHHIIDPHTGGFPAGVLSVTIVGPELATADAYATAAFAMGMDGPDWTRGLVAGGYEAMTILADEAVLLTPGFPGP